MKIFFSDFFEVDRKIIEKYEAFNISLLNDLPLFIDPFLLFNSKHKQYRGLHDNILKYVKFLKVKSDEGLDDEGLLKSWYCFPEVTQNWFGYSKSGNKGSGLGLEFARALNKNLFLVFKNFGEEKITKSSHLEKLCLIKDGVGKDNISDFTTNLIKEFLLEYTEEFSKNYIDEKHLKKFNISRVSFNYDTESWITKSYILPNFNNDFVLLTPKNILSRDNTWINKTDLISEFENLQVSLPNDSLRSQISNYFLKNLPKDANSEERRKAIDDTLIKFPVILDYYIKEKEKTGYKAQAISAYNVKESEILFIKQVIDLYRLIDEKTGFYKLSETSKVEALKRINYLKHVIENEDGYKYFYLNGKPIRREEDLHTLFKFVWYATIYDVNSEVNKGRGPVDFKISLGNFSKTLVEFKLGSNTQLERNLKNQVSIYKKANQTENAYKVILFFDDKELKKIENILKKLNLDKSEDVIVIDGRVKKSASKV